MFPRPRPLGRPLGLPRWLSEASSLFGVLALGFDDVDVVGLDREDVMLGVGVVGARNRATAAAAAWVLSLSRSFSLRTT